MCVWEREKGFYVFESIFFFSKEQDLKLNIVKVKKQTGLHTENTLHPILIEYGCSSECFLLTNNSTVILLFM